jgi:hypothetical protein
MKLKVLHGAQLLQIGLLLMILVNSLVLQLPYLSTICTLLVLFHQIFLTRPNLLGAENNDIQPLKTNDDTYLISEQLKETINYDLTVINSEIHRTNDIVKSATLAISDSFKQLKELSDNQTATLESIIINFSHLTNELTGVCSHLDHVEASSEQKRNSNKQSINQMIGLISQLNSLFELKSKELTDISLQLNDATSIGIRALQFEDLTTQILISIEQNTQTITKLSNDIPVLFEYLTTNNIEKLITFKQKMLDINNSSKQRNKTRSVEQTSMDEGEVELF